MEDLYHLPTLDRAYKKNRWENKCIAIAMAMAYSPSTLHNKLVL
jgi:hypothetical protein